MSKVSADFGRKTLPTPLVFERSPYSVPYSLTNLKSTKQVVNI